MPVGVELRLWNGIPGGGGAQSEVDSDIAAGDGVAGWRLPPARAEGVRQPGGTRGRPDPQRISLLLLYVGWVSWRAHNRRTTLAGDNDGAVLREGIPRKYQAS